MRTNNEELHKYGVKVVVRGRCMACGKELEDGIFFCKECEEKGRKKENDLKPKWIVEKVLDREIYKCPNCKEYADYFVDGVGDRWHKEMPNYCPNCGERLTP